MMKKVQDLPPTLIPVFLQECKELFEVADDMWSDLGISPDDEGIPGYSDLKHFAGLRVFTREQPGFCDDVHLGDVIDTIRAMKVVIKRVEREFIGSSAALELSNERVRKLPEHLFRAAQKVCQEAASSWGRVRDFESRRRAYSRLHRFLLRIEYQVAMKKLAEED